MKIIYKIIFGTDLSLQKDVQYMLDKGWKLYGYPFATTNIIILDEYSLRKTAEIAQAMIFEGQCTNCEAAKALDKIDALSAYCELGGTSDKMLGIAREGIRWLEGQNK